MTTFDRGQEIRFPSVFLVERRLWGLARRKEYPMRFSNDGKNGGWYYEKDGEWKSLNLLEVNLDPPHPREPPAEQMDEGGDG